MEPIFAVPIDESTRALAFAIPPDELQRAVSAEQPGWFFVLVEPAHRIRFGFDLGTGAVGPGAAPPPATWNDLTWDHVVDGRGFASATREVRPTEPVQAVWGGLAACAADVARIAVQRPVRLALHASRMVDAAP
jgi:hypothetical protein